MECKAWIKMGEESKKQEYIQIRDSFQRLKQSELEKISSIDEQMTNLEQAKKRCYEVIEENIPKTDGGVRICPKCEIKSMVYKGIKRKFVATATHDRAMDNYTCEICGHEQQEDAGVFLK